jgi:predicted enzyme related to lactoylglutathione lyase
MTAPVYNSVGWFEVATDRPDEARAFYGNLFGWTFGDMGGPYNGITTPGSDAPSGGLFDSEGRFPNYGIFYVVVEDVAATLAKAEALGAKPVMPRTQTDAGLVFAQLRDVSGNHFGIFTPPPVD